MKHANHRVWITTESLQSQEAITEGIELWSQGEELPGWGDEITAGAESIDSLPKNANNYLDRLSELCETPVKIIGVGPDRKETLFRD